MRVTGYKLNGYNATYEKVDLDVQHGKNGNKSRVLEITDINAGISYTFEIDKIFDKKPARSGRKK